MSVASFKVKSKMLMYKCQGIGWINIFHFALDLYDIIMWLIQ